jgi:uroporphyrinogen decarboxylase
MMNSCDRIRNTIAHIPSDRAPADGTFSAPVWQALRTFYKTDDDEQVLIALGIDFRQTIIEPSNEFAAKAVPSPVSAEDVGVGSRNLVHILPNGDFEDDWGICHAVSSSGKYSRFTHHPLGGANSPESYTFPNLNLPERYEHIQRQVQRFKGKFMIEIETGNIFREAWELRGFYQFMIDIHRNQNFVTRLLDLITEYKIAEVAKLIDSGVDIVQLVGDVAGEQNMLISPHWWRTEIKPRLAKVIAATLRPGIYYYFHSDGAMQTILPDLIEIGFDIVNPLQPECMDVVAIKRQYGAQFTMHSTLSSQQTLPFGSPHDVQAEVHGRIRDCGYDGGLILAPSNIVQYDVPLENLLSLYDEIKYSRS